MPQWRLTTWLMVGWVGLFVVLALAPAPDQAVFGFIVVGLPVLVILCWSLQGRRGLEVHIEGA